MDVEIERPIEQLGSQQIRDALLALTVLPTVALVRLGVHTAEASARAAADLVALTPLKGPVFDLQMRWTNAFQSAEVAVGRTLEGTMVRLLELFDPVPSVLDRIDVNQLIAEKVDIDAVIDRVDVVELAREVVAELDLPEIVRDSSQTMAAETVDGVRVHGMNADRSVSEFVDRLLRRKTGRGPGIDPTPPVGQTT